MAYDSAEWKERRPQVRDEILEVMEAHGLTGTQRVELCTEMLYWLDENPETEKPLKLDRLGVSRLQVQPGDVICGKCLPTRDGLKFVPVTEDEFPEKCPFCNRDDQPFFLVQNEEE